MVRGLPREEEKMTALSLGLPEGPALARVQSECPLLSLRAPFPLGAHPSLPVDPLRGYRVLADVAPGYSTALRIIKHIEQHQSCDWLISKELTN